MKAVIFLVAAFLALGCVSQQDYTPLPDGIAGTVAAAGDTISVHYAGALTNGTVFDSSVGGEPLKFVLGSGQLIKGFDQAVVGMKIGDEKTVTIEPEDAYGFPDEDNVIEVLRENVPVGVKEGDTIYADNRPVKVVEIRNDTVLVDFNHPLAGETLVFDIRIVKIEKG